MQILVYFLSILSLANTPQIPSPEAFEKEFKLGSELCQKQNGQFFFTWSVLNFTQFEPLRILICSKSKHRELNQYKLAFGFPNKPINDYSIFLTEGKSPESRAITKMLFAASADLALFSIDPQFPLKGNSAPTILFSEELKLNGQPLGKAQYELDCQSKPQCYLRFRSFNSTGKTARELVAEINKPENQRLKVAVFNELNDKAIRTLCMSRKNKTQVVGAAAYWSNLFNNDEKLLVVCGEKIYNQNTFAVTGLVEVFTMVRATDSAAISQFNSVAKFNFNSTPARMIAAENQIEFFESSKDYYPDLTSNEVSDVLKTQILCSKNSCSRTTTVCEPYNKYYKGALKEKKSELDNKSLAKLKGAQCI